MVEKLMEVKVHTAWLNITSSLINAGCDPLVPLTNGSIIYDQPIQNEMYPFLTTASHDCDRSNSFALVGFIRRTCFGNWSETDSMCRGIYNYYGRIYELCM